MTQLDDCQVKLASVSAFANHCRQKSGWSGLVVGVFLCDGRRKRQVERGNFVLTGADIRLITLPYAHHTLLKPVATDFVAIQGTYLPVASLRTLPWPNFG